MTPAQRKRLSGIMRGAWSLARYGARRFGGRAFLYFAISLRLVWQEEKKPRNIWRPGVGKQFVLPFLEMQSQVIRGQFCLPGVSK
ncbi:MAG: alanyl-tRNA synthetase [Desulfovibrio sp.]|nr:alanyl-tRNA synthetase [Desulfovibrio sp.]